MWQIDSQGSERKVSCTFMLVESRALWEAQQLQQKIHRVSKCKVAENMSHLMPFLTVVKMRNTGKERKVANGFCVELTS